MIFIPDEKIDELTAAAFAAEGDENVTNDTESPQDLSDVEVNTFDAIPLASPHKSGGFLKSLFYLATVMTVLLAVILSSAEIIDYVMNELGTGNIIMKRVFGSWEKGEGLNLGELVLKNVFLLPNDHHSPDSPVESERPSESRPTPSIPQESIPAPESGTLRPIESEKEPDVLPSPEDGLFPIIRNDLSYLSYGENYIYNDTGKSPDVSALASANLKSYYKEGSPTVLVLHTHATEAYSPDGALTYNSEEEIARSDDTSENMVAIGKEFVRVLEENGIVTIHCTILHDKESYRESYSRAAETIKEYLRLYPNIGYVFDLHRDSVMTADGELVSSMTQIGGESSAQVMAVVGSAYDGWEENMTFALKLRALLNGENPKLCRPVCLRSSGYNQQLAPISLILEVGTSGNSLSEAKKAAALAAEAVSRLIKP